MVGITWRRTAIRGALRAVAAIPARHGTPIAELPVLQDVEPILEQARLVAPIWCASAAYWPVQPDRGRAYLHLLDENGDAVAFLKLANGEDAGALDRERAALETLDGGTHRFSTPRLRASGMEGGTRWLLTEPLPRIGRQAHNLRMPVPEEVIDDIRGETRFVPADEVGCLSWWDDLQERLRQVPSAFVEDIGAAVTNGLHVGRSHGDFGTHNIATVSERIWVFDWEAFAPDAPIDQDIVNFHLVRGDVLDAIRGRPGRDSFQRFVTCCAFGLARGANGFEPLVKNWMSWE